MRVPYWIEPQREDALFPPVSHALEEPNGLLAMGGNLSSQRLLSAYRSGIFPWYSEGQPILWWSPEPRSVLRPERLRISRSLRRRIRREEFEVYSDRAFGAVLQGCAGARVDQEGTWLTKEMIAAYNQLHDMGFAHSIEAWQDGRLVGGLYGVVLGRIYFGESMFTRVTDASKVAFVHLVRYVRERGFPIIDCQVQTRHLDSLGAETIPRSRFIELLNRYCGEPGPAADWRLPRYDGESFFVSPPS